jgi:hypothetical protein
MNIKLIRLLVSACIGLCVVIAAEWLFVTYTQHDLLTSISAEIKQDYKADELPEIELTKLPEESYVDLVARPLFIKGRRPVDEPKPESEQAAVVKEVVFDWQLNGVYGKGENKSALFSRSKSKVAKDNFRKITVGDDLDGWKLTKINTDKVMFMQGGLEKELLLRKPKLKGPSPRTNGAVPPVPGATPEPAAVPEPAADIIENTNEDTPEGNQ